MDKIIERINNQLISELYFRAKRDGVFDEKSATEEIE